MTLPGAWLYAEGGSDPILHAIGGRRSEELVKGVIEHMAFTGHGLADTVARLKARSVQHELRKLPGYGTWQLFFYDPNGAKMAIDFDAAEPGAA